MGISLGTGAAAVHRVGVLLTALGRHGPTLLVTSLILGSLVPLLSSQAVGLLPIAAFLLALGSFQTANFAPREGGSGRAAIALALAWNGLGVPAATAALLLVTGLGEDLRKGILMSVLAPPISGAAAIAAILGLHPRLALVNTIGLTLLTPLTVPLLAVVLRAGVRMDPASLALHLALIVGPAGLVSLTLSSAKGRLPGLIPDMQAASGIAVLGLVLVGFTMADSLRGAWGTQRESVLTCLAVATGLNLGLGLVSGALFSPLGRTRALTIALVAGNRNVSLTWAAAGTALSHATELYLATTVVPVLALPFAVQIGARVRGWVAPRSRRATNSDLTVVDKSPPAQTGQFSTSPTQSRQEP
jgi:arsenite transporter